MTDKELYELCKKLGKKALEARRKFAGLLPEVFRRRLYEKKGFSSIYEFAAKLAGMSHEQVDIVLRLERKFEDRPILQKALIDGEISANKLVRIASIATVENQEELFEKVKIFSKRAVETFVRDVKKENSDADTNGFAIPLFGQKVLPGQNFELGLKLDPDVENELAEMQGKGIDINEFLREALKKRKEKLEEEKAKIATEIDPAQRDKTQMEQNKKIRVTRYISMKVRKIINEEHGTKCSIPGCTRPAKALHHTQRFALSNIHDPRFIAPLCEEHHEIAHKIDIKYVRMSSG